MNYSFIIECPRDCNGMDANNTIKHALSLEFFRKKFSGYYIWEVEGESVSVLIRDRVYTQVGMFVHENLSSYT